MLAKHVRRCFGHTVAVSIQSGTVLISGHLPLSPLTDVQSTFTRPILSLLPGTEDGCPTNITSLYSQIFP